MHLPGKMVVRVMGGFTEALCYLGRGGWAEAPTKGGGNCLAAMDGKVPAWTWGS